MNSDENVLPATEEIRETSITDLMGDDLPESLRRALQRFRDNLQRDDNVARFQSFA